MQGSPKAVPPIATGTMINTNKKMTQYPDTFTGNKLHTCECMGEQVSFLKHLASCDAESNKERSCAVKP